MNIGDIVKKSSHTYYQYIDYNNSFEVTETKPGSSCPLIRIKRVQSSQYLPEGVWYKSSNFKLMKESNNPKMNELFLVFSMNLATDGVSYDINLQAGAVQFSSEKEAKDAVSNHLTENPESVYGIFPLGYLAKVERPPVKFTQVWKKNY